MSSPSRVKRIRSDRGILLGCLTISALLLGTVGIQHITEDNRQAEIAKQQAETAKREAEQKQSELAKRKERDRAWIAWRDYAEPLCTDSLPAIKEGLNLTRVRRNGVPGKLFVQEGLIVCDRIRVGIVQRKQNRLVLSYVVPKAGFTYPLPTAEPPPPEFAPAQPNQ
jgi:hypothetical protein